MIQSKFSLGEKVEIIDLSVKSDFPSIGIIIKSYIRLGRYFHTVKFDKPLFKKPIISQVYNLCVYEDRIKSYQKVKEK